ncbi:MAG: matrixin family metalloprotease [Planctomycetales bacterium]|nr:matrixin family metalloprotease [Planctomycetales bacterium]
MTELPKRRNASRRLRRSDLERLESRELLHGGHTVWGDFPQLTISFADDGVIVAGEQNVLHADFDQRFGENEWQTTILSAFQVWAASTNANIALVDEVDALPFGTPGARVRDARFGDIRIGARPLSNDVAAVSVSHNAIVSGTWAGDVVFNSRAEYSTLDELYTIALHEAGHIFGLEHSDNPNSPMHFHGASSASMLLAEDREAIVELYGERERDAYEDRGGNNRLWSASVMPLYSESRHDNTPQSIVFGDLTTDDDIDFYYLRIPHDYDGPISVTLRTDGISLVDANVDVFDRLGRPIERVAIDDHSFRVDEARGELFLRVDSPREDAFAIGGYALSATLGDASSENLESLIDLIKGRIANLNSDDVDSYFADREGRLRGDEHTDDRFERAREISRQRQSNLLVNLGVVGSISDESDVDFYRLTVPYSQNGDQSHAYISVRILEEATLVPKLTVLDSSEKELPSEVLVNGNGELIVQIPNLEAGSRITFGVSPDSEVLAFQQGNYEVNVWFSEEATNITDFVSGAVGESAASTHELYVATTQLFHFALQVSGDDRRSGAMIQLVDSSGTVVHSITAPQGQTRTNGSALLLPGKYSLAVIPLRSPDAETTPMAFSLQGVAISDPFGIDPVLPEDTEYDCTDVADQYCFPNGTQTSTPFTWDDFVVLLEDFNVDPSAVEEILLTEWWDAFWGTEPSTETPTASDETYQTDVDEPLEVSAEDGVLSNDDITSNLSIATIVSQPQHGRVSLDYDGSFIYVPASGFEGVDTFNYVVSDLRNRSEVATVAIAVGNAGLPGDLNGNGILDVGDIDAVSLAIRGNVAFGYDVNLDGQSNSLDRDDLIFNQIGTVLGDANLDGVFDSSDFVLVFQAGQYEDGVSQNSGWASGDWNGDGEFSTLDLVVAFQGGAYVSSSAVAGNIDA